VIGAAAVTEPVAALNKVKVHNWKRRVLRFDGGTEVMCHPVTERYPVYYCLDGLTRHKNPGSCGLCGRGGSSAFSGCLTGLAL